MIAVRDLRGSNSGLAGVWRRTTPATPSPRQFAPAQDRSDQTHNRGRSGFLPLLGDGSRSREPSRGRQLSPLRRRAGLAAKGRRPAGSLSRTPRRPRADRRHSPVPAPAASALYNFADPFRALFGIASLLPDNDP